MEGAVDSNLLILLRELKRCVRRGKIYHCPSIKTQINCADTFKTSCQRNAIGNTSGCGCSANDNHHVCQMSV
eukprot:scaffold156306_cov34-Prasinocladus_malaysianus.AAC.2